MDRREFIKLGALGAAAVGAGESRGAAPRPNILFILVDDLGKEWIGCYGAEDIETPHVDALAAGGMRFENAYSMAQCTPSRASLLTGRYPFRTGYVNHWDVPRWGVGYFDWAIPRNLTFARVLREAGYATAAAGKWQINDFRLTPDAMRRHGFDDWCMWTGFEAGNPASAERYWDPYVNTPAGSRTLPGAFGPDVFTDFLIGFMEAHRAEPMLLYYPMALTHAPFVHTPAEPDVRDKLAKHKAMVRYTDRLVGRLTEALDRLGIRERTVVVFTTDNGSGGVTGTRNGRKVKGAKGKISEPGLCQPYIVNCPGTVPAGTVSTALTDFTDLFPTFCELAGAPVPAGSDLDGVSVAPVWTGRAQESPRDWICGMGHGPAIVDREGIRGRTDYAERAIRDRRFKVWVNEARRITALYDLLADPAEETNLLPARTPAHRDALAKFGAIVAGMPKQDARPAYTPRPPNPWDRKPAGD